MMRAMQTHLGWRARLAASLRPYLERGPLASFFLGISSGAPYAMIAATLTTRLAQQGIRKQAVTAFALAFLVYNLKWLWAWMVDGVHIPLLGRLGQRVSWLLLAGSLAMASIVFLGLSDPQASLVRMAWAAVLVGVAGATYDIVIDAYRIELLEPRQLGVGSGMTQYGWRIGSAGAAAMALYVAARHGWQQAYGWCALLALPGMLTGLVCGEPKRHRTPSARKGLAEVWASIVGPLAEFASRQGALLVLLFILLHKIGDTLATLTFRLLFNSLGFSNDEIALYDVGVGFWAFMIGILAGVALYNAVGMKRSVLVSLGLMGVSNFSFAALAAAGHSNLGMGAAIGFENFASGLGGVTVAAYFAALTDLRFTGAQYALISAAASVVGRLLTGTSAGALIEAFGYVRFYLLTTAIALPGIVLFWVMMRMGLVERSLGSAGRQESTAPAARP